MTSYSYKMTAYLPASVAAISQEEKTEIAEEKKGAKKLMGKFKDKIGSLNKYPLVLKKLNTEEALKSFIDDYIIEMKKKQAVAKLSPQEEKQWQALIDSKQEAIQELKDYNSNYRKTSPQYHATLQNNALAQAGKDRKEFIRVEGTDAKVDNCKYYIKNESSTTFTYMNAEQEKGTVGPGKTQEFDCYYITFFAEGDKKGNVIWGGGQASRDKTYIHK